MTDADYRYVTVHVAMDLLAEMGDWSEPVQVQITQTPGRGTGYELIARVPVGDDTSVAGALKVLSDGVAPQIAAALIVAADAQDSVPVGDDTPAPTGQWTVDWVATPSSMIRGLFRDGERVPLPEVARILNRAGAAPDLTALDVEALAEAVHQAYLDTSRRLGWPVKPANQVPYAELSEDSKELDRAAVRAVLAAVAALVREDAEDQTPHPEADG